MKCLRKDATVWAIPEIYYRSNTYARWTEFQAGLLHDFPEAGWRALSHPVKEQYVLLDECMEPWCDGLKDKERVDCLFYRFPEAIDGYVGFVYFKDDMIDL